VFHAASAAFVALAAAVVLVPGAPLGLINVGLAAAALQRPRRARAVGQPDLPLALPQRDPGPPEGPAPAFRLFSWRAWSRPAWAADPPGSTRVDTRDLTDANGGANVEGHRGHLTRREVFDGELRLRPGDIDSGFGGSVAALRAAEKGYRVGIMESGRRWPDEDIALGRAGDVAVVEQGRGGPEATARLRLREVDDEVRVRG